MPSGFLKKAVLNSFETSSIPKCNKCGLYKECKSPKMKVTGKGKKEILVVGEYPGRFEDERNTQFFGKSGQTLRKSLEKAGIDLDEDCWKTNAVICSPNGKPNNKIIGCCFPNVKNTILELKPRVVILLGFISVSSVIGWLWKPKTGGIARWVGWHIPSQKINAWVCPTYRPSYVLGEENGNVDLEFDRHLKDAVNLTGRPWSRVPEYSNQIDVERNTSQAARVIRKMIALGGRASWDLECTTLKPDGPEAEIVCCSVCWEGKKTVAFPWEGEAIVAMEEFLVSSLKKIAANLKYETRYVNSRLGVRVKNWYFDTMQAAHILDNRKSITGLKFQSFVKLGQPAYDEHIVPYFKSEGTNKSNKIKRMDLSELLLYCGMDSLLEYKLAEIQMKELGIE